MKKDVKEKDLYLLKGLICLFIRKVLVWDRSLKTGQEPIKERKRRRVRHMKDRHIILKQNWYVMSIIIRKEKWEIKNYLVGSLSRWLLFLSKLQQRSVKPCEDPWDFWQSEWLAPTRVLIHGSSEKSYAYDLISELFKSFFLLLNCLRMIKEQLRI